MIIVLKQHAPADKVQAFCNELNSMGFQINDSVGSATHILGLIGDTKALAESGVVAVLRHDAGDIAGDAAGIKILQHADALIALLHVEAAHVLIAGDGVTDALIQMGHAPSSTWADTRSAAVTLPS